MELQCWLVYITSQVLSEVLGARTCGQLLQPDTRARLPLLFSDTAAGFFLEAALGLGQTRHGPQARARCCADRPTHAQPLTAVLPARGGVWAWWSWIAAAAAACEAVASDVTERAPRPARPGGPGAGARAQGHLC
jgi:hypothetical protein